MLNTREFQISEKNVIFSLNASLKYKVYSETYSQMGLIYCLKV